jgi:hypothetical protein
MGSRLLTLDNQGPIITFIQSKYLPIPISIFDFAFFVLILIEIKLDIFLVDSRRNRGRVPPIISRSPNTIKILPFHPYQPMHSLPPVSNAINYGRKIELQE